MLVAASAWGGLAYTGIYQVEAEYRALKATLDHELQQQAFRRRSLETAETREVEIQQEQEQQAQVLTPQLGSRWYTACRPPEPLHGTRGLML